MYTNLLRKHTESIFTNILGNIWYISGRIKDRHDLVCPYISDIKNRLYLVTQPHHPDQIVTCGHFLSGLHMLWIKSFPSFRLVASLRPKKLVCPFIYREQRDSCLLKRQHEQPRSEIYLCFPFPMSITVTLGKVGKLTCNFHGSSSFLFWCDCDFISLFTHTLCLNFLDGSWKLSLLRIFGVLISFLFLFSQRFGRYTLRPSSC